MREVAAEMRMTDVTFSRVGWFGDTVIYLAPSAEELRAAAREVERGLPVVGRLERLHLMAGAPSRNAWRVVAELPLSTS